VVDQTLFLLDVGVMAGSALILSLLFVRFKLPIVSAQVLAGMVVGPSVLGLVRDPIIINDIASVGIVLLLFIIGLELDPTELRKVVGRVAILTAIEVVIAFAFGLMAAYVLHFTQLQSVIFAMTASISSTAIVGKVFLERGMLRAEQSRLMVGVLVMEDIAAVGFLTVIASIASAGTSSAEMQLLQIFEVGVGGVAILVLGYAIARYVAPYAINYLSHYEGEFEEIPFLFALGLGFAFGVLASVFGYSPGTGAFIIGLSIRGKQSKFLTAKLRTIKDLFLVLFFVSMGSMINPFPSLLLGLPILFLMTVTIAGKFVGGYGVGRLISDKLAGSAKAEFFGVWLIPRGEFSFVIGQLALSLGMIDENLFSLIGLTVIVTTLVGPLLQRFIEGPVAESIHPYKPEKDR
jgi:CPA2 family monovalent cation:H+ antiporter-2